MNTEISRSYDSKAYSLNLKKQNKVDKGIKAVLPTYMLEYLFLLLVTPFDEVNTALFAIKFVALKVHFFVKEFLFSLLY